MKLDNINGNDEEYPLQNSCDHCCQFNTEAQRADNKQIMLASSKCNLELSWFALHCFIASQ